jgi:hypothetical protein
LGFGISGYRYRGGGWTRTRIVKAEIPTKRQILQALSSVLSNLSYVSAISNSEYDPEDDALVKYELLMIKGYHQNIPIRILCDEASPGLSCAVWVAGYFNAGVKRYCRPFPEDIVRAIYDVVSLYRRVYGDTPVTSEPEDWREYWEEDEDEDYCDPYDPLASSRCWLDEDDYWEDEDL